MEKTIVSIADFGAKAGCNVVQTKEIQAAIDHCFLAGGGEVQVPEGTFLTGGLRLRSHVTLHLLENAVLKGSRNPEDYFSYLTDEVEPLPAELITDSLWNRGKSPEERDLRFLQTPGSRWHNGLIKAICAHDISIIGERGSVLDGSDCYDELGEERYRGPHCIDMFYCENIMLAGYTIKDSANWAHSIYKSDNITAKNLTVLAGHDGFHVRSCQNVIISDCEFYTGDDGVAGFSNTNVLVVNCVLNSACSAFRFGGTNVLIEKCHMYGPCKYLFRGSLSVEEKKNGIINPDTVGHRNNMLSAFTYYADYTMDIPHQPGNIIIRDCKVDYADRFLHYNFSGNERWQRNRPLESITFENITATNISIPIHAYGDPDVPIKLTMKNIDFSFREGFEDIVFMKICHYERILLENIRLKGYKGDTLIQTWSDGEIIVKDLDCPELIENYIKPTTETFVCKQI